MGLQTRASSSLRQLRRSRTPKALLLLLFVWSFLELLFVQQHLNSPEYGSDKPSASEGHRIYIASMQWNTEYLLRDRWSEAILHLVKTLGPENVFITIFESGSFDNTKVALWELDQELGKLNVNRHIEWSEHTHLEEISKKPAGPGWVKTPRGKTELRRIPYLSKLRNHLLEDLESQHQKGITYDKVLFLNDVVFNVKAPGSRHAAR